MGIQQLGCGVQRGTSIIVHSDQGFARMYCTLYGTPGIIIQAVCLVAGAMPSGGWEESSAGAASRLTYRLSGGIHTYVHITEANHATSAQIQ